MATIKRLLIANRGEIAVRIIRTAKEMGITTIAIFSELDRRSPHVILADEAYPLGGKTATESYLDMEKVMNLAKSAKADAIHPGYGFLSENALFAQLVADNGIIFIGPNPESIRIMGDKLTAKQAVAQFNVPLVPGLSEGIENIDNAKKVASEIGFPIMLKATAGGGGKGMRIVQSLEEFEEQFNRASSEAQNSFGNPTIFIEKYIESPRHIEFQLIADQAGNVIHLNERDCSIQRRHQKVIEEAPSGSFSHELRTIMGEHAINVAKSCSYINAGTVEFIMDENDNFYFLEMNTRLQVEHTVTELICGIDLVKEQILVAEGNNLRHRQEDIPILGHAIQLRVYAEDPDNNFLPDTGVIECYEPPTGPGVRVDDGTRQGSHISPYYDPMISKLIVWAEDRQHAIQRMKRAISEYNISGVQTTLGFGTFVMNHPAFINNEFDTHFTSKHFTTKTASGKELEATLIGGTELSPKPVIYSNPSNNVSNWKNRR